MSVEDRLRRLEEIKKLRDIKYAELRGMIKAMRLHKLSQADEDFLNLFELFIDGYKVFSDEYNASLQREIQTSQTLINLGARIKELENDILQLRQTLDRMVQDR